jgi:endo-1,4-beta-xylanase
MARALGHVCGHTPILWGTYYPFMVNQCNAIWANRLQSNGGVTYNITWNGWTSQTPYNTTASSMWYVSAVAMEQFTPAVQPPTHATGTHYLINKCNQLALDDPGSSTTNGTDMQQWAYNGGANQKWTFSRNSDGSYTIINGASGLALEDPDFETGNGTLVDQWTSNGGANQHWNLTDNQDGTYTIVNVASGLDLEDPASSTANGTLMDQWSNNNGPNQRWFFH